LIRHNWGGSVDVLTYVRVITGGVTVTVAEAVALPAALDATMV
jgi:hypothetical protein